MRQQLSYLLEQGVYINIKVQWDEFALSQIKQEESLASFIIGLGDLLARRAMKQHYETADWDCKYQMDFWRENV